MMEKHDDRIRDRNFLDIGIDAPVGDQSLERRHIGIVRHVIILSAYRIRGPAVAPF